jgi:hypothetical protein
MPSGTEDDTKTRSRIGHGLNATEASPLVAKADFFSVTFYETIFLWPWPPRCRGFTITLGRTSLDE